MTLQQAAGSFIGCSEDRDGWLVRPQPWGETGEQKPRVDHGIWAALDETRQDPIAHHREDHEYDPGHTQPTKPPYNHP